MITPGKATLKVYQGATWETQITLSSENTPIDISGKKARMQMRASITSEDVLMEASSDGGEIVIDGPQGIITITVPSNVTAALVLNGGVGVYVGDLELYEETDPEVVERILDIKFKVYPEVTRE